MPITILSGHETIFKQLFDESRFARMVLGFLQEMAQKTQTTTGAVLIVDDSSDDAVLIKYALAKLKLANPVRTVATAEEMIAYVEGSGAFANRAEFPYPALILLDFKLPQMNGLAAQAWLRSNVNHRKIPIIMTSSDMRTNVLQTAVRCGANGYLVKPITQISFRELCISADIRLQTDYPSQN